MAVSTISPEHARMLRKLDMMIELKPEDRMAAAALPLRIVNYNAYRDIVRPGARPTESFLLVEGFVHRYQVVTSGARQILAIHLSGDIPDLHSIYLNPMDHGLATLTPCKIGFIPHEAIRDTIRDHPRLAEALWRETLIDGAIFRAWITNIGRRSGIERIAHIFCELYYRMRVLNLATEHGFELPLSQTDIGDATGLTPVHVNRMLQRLRAEGIISSRSRFHTIKDWERLKRIAGFDPAYLNLSPLPD